MSTEVPVIYGALCARSSKTSFFRVFRALRRGSSFQSSPGLTRCDSMLSGRKSNGLDQQGGTSLDLRLVDSMVRRDAVQPVGSFSVKADPKNPGAGCTIQGVTNNDRPVARTWNASSWDVGSILPRSMLSMKRIHRVGPQRTSAAQHGQ